MGNEGGVNESINIWSSNCRISNGSLESLDERGLNAEENLTTAEELDASSSPKSSNSSTDSSELVSGSAPFAGEGLPFPLFLGAGGGG
jgi:hypothetical protein